MIQSTAAKPWVAIQRNPMSGAGSQRETLLQLIRELHRHEIVPRVFADRAQLARWIQDPQKRGRLRCIVAAGGDGTAADVFNRYPDIPVALLPMGTENLLSRCLGIECSGEVVGRMIAENRRRRLDLCELNHLSADPSSIRQRFAVVASAGFDADIIHRAHAARTGHITRLAYLQPICDTVQNYPYPPMRVWLDDATEPHVCRFVVVMNLPAYALGLPIAAQAQGDDGWLDVRLFEGGSLLQMLRYFTATIVRQHEGLSDVVSVRARRIRIESDVAVPMQVDGDPAGFTPAEIRILPGALDVYSPQGDVR